MKRLLWLLYFIRIIFNIYFYLYCGYSIIYIFLLNKNEKASPRTKDKTIFKALNKTMNIQINIENFNLIENTGFFMNYELINIKPI